MKGGYGLFVLLAAWLIVSPLIFVAAVKSKGLAQGTLGERVSLVRGISIRSSDALKNSEISFITQPWVQLVLSLDAYSGSFIISRSGIRILEIEEGLFTIFTQKVELHSLHYSDLMQVGKQRLRQWSLFTSDLNNLREDPTGWSDNSTYKCGSILMLGGYKNFAKGEVKKTFIGLPPHTQVRVTALFYFLDQWLGESAFMRINSHLTDDSRLEYVWVQKYDTSKLNSNNPINICGSDYPEFQFSFQIDISIPHIREHLVLAFGSTLETDNPEEASFGLSNLEIYIK